MARSATRTRCRPRVTRTRPETSGTEAMPDEEAMPPELRKASSDTSEFMRQVRIHTERAVKGEPGSLPVRLRGGPMDGFAVHDHAGVLKDDWYTTWPPSI